MWQWRKKISLLCKNFVDITHFRRLHLPCRSQFSTSEEDGWICVLSTCRPTDQQFYVAAIPWTFTYHLASSKPYNRLPSDPFATSWGCVVVVSRISGVRRGRILGLTLSERSTEKIPHLCQQHCICNLLTSQRASISLLIKTKNRSIRKKILGIILANLASLNQTNSYFSCIEAKACKASRLFVAFSAYLA